MSDGLKLTPRQAYILQACYENEAHYSEDGLIDPPYFSSDRRDCKILESHLLMRKTGEGWRLSGLGKDLARKLNAMDKEWVDNIAKDSATTPYR